MYNSLRFFFFTFSLIGVASNTQAGSIEPKRHFTPLPFPHEIKPQPSQEKPKPKKLLIESGTTIASVSLSGHVNRAMTYADNGVKQRLLHVDNDNSSSRIKVYSRAEISDRFTIGANFSFEMQSNDSSTTDISSDSGAVSFSQRETEAVFISKDFGTFSIGHGHTRSDTTSENDLSKTDVVALGCSADAMTGGLRFRKKHTRKKFNEGPVVEDVYTSMDGLSRRDRFRWDSPDIYGFSIGGSHVMQNSYDVGLNYNGKVYGTEIQGSIAHAKNRKKYKQTNGSVSILFPSGFNIGGGSGFREITIHRHHYNNNHRHYHRHHPYFYHGKIGYIMKPFAIGDTAIAIDRGVARHMLANRDLCFLTGAFLVQNIDNAATEIYIGVRHHKLKRFESKFHGIFAGFLGAKVRF